MKKHTPAQAAKQIGTELGQSSAKGHARLACALKDCEAAPGMIVVAHWSGSERPAKMRLLNLHRHPAGDCWAVNIYDWHRRRFSKIVQYVAVADIDAAIAKATGGAA